MPIIPAFALPRRVVRLHTPLAAFRRFLRWCLLCHARAAQRRHLAELDDHMLKDVGVTPEQAARESAKPWWRA